MIEPFIIITETRMINEIAPAPGTLRDSLDKLAAYRRSGKATRPLCSAGYEDKENTRVHTVLACGRGKIEPGQSLRGSNGLALRPSFQISTVS